MVGMCRVHLQVPAMCYALAQDNIPPPVDLNCAITCDCTSWHYTAGLNLLIDKRWCDKIKKEVRCCQHVDDPSLCRNLTCVDSAILWQMQSVSSLQHFGSCHIYLS